MLPQAKIGFLAAVTLGFAHTVGEFGVVRITRKSRDQLGIATGTAVHALIKRVALAD